MDERTVAWDVMGTVVEIAPVTERYGGAAMPRLLHLALSLQSLGEFVPFPRLVAAELGEEALEVFASLDPCPDAEPAMRTLQEAGIRQVALTNGSVENTETLLERGGLRHFVDRIHSVEEVRAYKPAPEPYGLVDAASTVLIAVHDWDVAGARRGAARRLGRPRGGRLETSPTGTRAGREPGRGRRGRRDLEACCASGTGRGCRFRHGASPLLGLERPHSASNAHQASRGSGAGRAGRCGGSRRRRRRRAGRRRRRRGGR